MWKGLEKSRTHVQNCKGTCVTIARCFGGKGQGVRDGEAQASSA